LIRLLNILKYIYFFLLIDAFGRDDKAITVAPSPSHNVATAVFTKNCLMKLLRCIGVCSTAYSHAGMALDAAAAADAVEASLHLIPRVARSV